MARCECTTKTIFITIYFSRCKKEMTANSRSQSEIAIQILEGVNDLGEEHLRVTKTTLMYEVFLNSN
ncbi:MAG: hypothetical protein M3270_01180 [Thermoproteota archaeon]|nr:hypothetical protein [Thermoproteota archaeon]